MVICANHSYPPIRVETIFAIMIINMDIYKSKDDKWTAYKYAKEMKHTEIAELLKSNKDQIVLLIDNCDACRAKEKIFHKLAKNYPSFPRSSVITTTPDNDKNSKEHNWNIKFPFVKIGDSKTLDGDVMSAFHPGHRLDNWDGTEKQLETIMYMLQTKFRPPHICLPIKKDWNP